MSMEFDLTTFRRGLQAKLKVTRKAEAEVLNDAGRNVAYRALRNTKPAAKADVQASLNQIVPWARDGHQVRLKYLLANAYRIKRGQKVVTGMEMSSAAKRLERQRYRSRAYIKAGWFNAVRSFGGNPRGKAPSPKGLAALGYGKKATGNRLVAELTNFSRGAGLVGAEPLQLALDDVGRDMQGYADKRLARAFK